MHNSSFEESQNDVLYQHNSSSASLTRKHGLDIPSENLTHITACLDPHSLLSLSRVNTQLYAHVKEEHTWRTAFALNFLGIGPEGDLSDFKGRLLRRSEPSWRREYIVRYNLRRRWERSRTATIIHTPVLSPIMKIHLLSSNTLLSSSLKYGIVARSVPLTGKVLRGFLSPSPSGTGLGTGNPNTEFSPHVSACDIASDGGTAKIAWGFRSGEVSVMIASKVMDMGTRSAAKLIRCPVEDEHAGEVADVVWDDFAGVVVSAGKDGMVKVWETKKVHCIWSSIVKVGVLDPCVKVVSKLSKGCILAGLQSGDITIWTGYERDGTVVNDIHETRIPCPMGQLAFPTISSIHVDTSDPQVVALLVTYEAQPYFYGISLTPTLEVTKYGDSSCGTITALFSSFASKLNESSLVVVGDILGWISVYDWTSKSRQPVRRFEAHSDGSAVTAIAWNGVTLLVGSAKGQVDAFDAYTFEHLRTFSTQVSRRGEQSAIVQEIIVSPEKDVLIVSLGDRVMAWKAGVVPRNGSGGVRARNMTGKKRSKGVTSSKGHAQLDLKASVSESLALLKQEQERARQAHSRERKQRENLENLGLSEVEAVEYLLMLSRDEQAEKEREAMNIISARVEEGVFEWDVDDNLRAGPSAATHRQSATPSLPSGQISRLSLKGEQTEASSSKDQQSPTPSSLSSEKDFPFVGKSRSASSSAGSISVWDSGSPKRRLANSPWGSPRAGVSAATTPPMAHTSGSPSSLYNQRQRQEEEDLRLAIQLSLEEASRSN
ncbi:WD40-repeat-containing domain protein [Armillaria novae-zelandiae]|uniref:WD40-repeat-containing domain protein n=1 Tax=Armillaria novae-zelandiae TaxID=153914 RepID=A0AA39PWA7_9AGAR|nr:WD40-repeat-containing domain protein [Armillaria novae-zelandiae]